MRREFVEAFFMSRQNHRVLVNIFSCRGGACLGFRQRIEKAVFLRQPHGTGIEIKDRLSPESIVRIGYLKLQKINIMEMEDIIVTFIYETLHVEVIIK